MPAFSGAFPLDLEQVAYSYVERPNVVLLDLLASRVFDRRADARILDVGCGAGANARAIKAKHARVVIHGIEPNAGAAKLARDGCDDVFAGDTSAWSKRPTKETYDAVVLADVLEHIADPLRFLRDLARSPAVRDATWIISVPNYAVWYNRVLTLAGRFEYAWSGLYDRTHLRFFTRRSLHEVLKMAGLAPIEDRCTPSIVQSAAPLLRKLFDEDVARGDHLSLPRSPAYRVYERAVEPIERRVCAIWPELLGFQIVTAAALAPAR